MSKPITILRKQIMDTIKRPDFLEKSNSSGISVNDIAWNNSYEILYRMLDCVRSCVLSQKAIDDILISIGESSYELDNILNGKQQLYTWIWIHGMIGAWLDMALELDQFETAANLKKIIDVIYNENVSAYEGE